MESTFKQIIKRLNRDKNYHRFEPWFKANGDKTHRLNYDLNEHSQVFDIGGYEGQWASDIFSKYLCHINIFGPYFLYAENISQRFVYNKKIKVHPFGLSNETRSTFLSISDDGSSVYKKASDKTEIKLVSVTDFIKEHKINQIDLMKISIEGGEYDLLEHLIETSYINRIYNIQVQFHDFVPDAEKRMIAIQQNLAKTHKLTYQYKFVWENWKLK